MHNPDLAVQRAAMKKLEFLVGKWSGEGHRLLGPGAPVTATQTEEAQYKLDGLLLLIEGGGLANALGVVSYDDESGKYHMRAFNDGLFMETEVKLLEDGKGMSWGFVLGEYKTTSVMRIDEQGNWTEHHEITIGDRAPMKLMNLSVSRM